MIFPLWRETKKCLFKTSLSCFAGLIAVRKLSRPSRKASRTRVSFCDGMRWTPRKYDESEDKIAPKEMERPKENPHSRSSSLSTDPNSIGVVNKGFYVSALDLYSDDESNDTSHAVKEPVPIVNVTDVSVENENTLLSGTKTNIQSSLNLGNTDCAIPQEESKSLLFL